MTIYISIGRSDFNTHAPAHTGRRGRPATGFDKKAHDREKARARRAAKRRAKGET